MQTAQSVQQTLIVPHGRDQNDNAVRVTAGMMLQADASAAAFKSAIEEVLSDPGYAVAARTLGRQVADEVEQSPVVEELERLASCRCGTTDLKAA